MYQCIMLQCYSVTQFRRNGTTPYYCVQRYRSQNCYISLLLYFSKWGICFSRKSMLLPCFLESKQNSWKMFKIVLSEFFLMRWYGKSAGKDTPIKWKVEKRANSCHLARWITGKHQMMFSTCPNIAAMGCKCVCGERILKRIIYFKMLCVIYKMAWKCKNTRWINS